MAAGGVALGRHLAVQERVPVPDHAHEAVPEQRLHPHLRSGVAQHADSRSTSPSRSGRTSLSGLGAKRRRTPGAVSVTAATRRAANVSTKPSLARTVKVRSRAARSSRGRGPQHGPGLLRQVLHALAQPDGVRRRHQAPAGADQQRVAGRGAQARQRAAHGRGAQAEPPRGAGHAALGQQGVERHQQVQVEIGHDAASLTRRMWRPHAAISCVRCSLPPRLRGRHSSSDPRRRTPMPPCPQRMRRSWPGAGRPHRPRGRPGARRGRAAHAPAALRGGGHPGRDRAGRAGRRHRQRGAADHRRRAAGLARRLGLGRHRLPGGAGHGAAALRRARREPGLPPGVRGRRRAVHRRLGAVRAVAHPCPGWSRPASSRGWAVRPSCR